MPVILDFFYREYCRARLVEMRKQLPVRAQSHETSEANSDASHPVRTDRPDDSKHEAADDWPD